MVPKEKNQHQRSLFFSFSDTLNQKYPLYILASKIQWEVFEKAFAPLYSADTGRPAKPIRLMVGLLMLKHTRNLSDEMVVSNGARIAIFSTLQAKAPLYPASHAKLQSWYILGKE